MRSKMARALPLSNNVHSLGSTPTDILLAGTLGRCSRYTSISAAANWRWNSACGRPMQLFRRVAPKLLPCRALDTTTCRCLSTSPAMALTTDARASTESCRRCLRMRASRPRASNKWASGSSLIINQAPCSLNSGGMAAQALIQPSSSPRPAGPHAKRVAALVARSSAVTAVRRTSAPKEERPRSASFSKRWASSDETTTVLCSRWSMSCCRLAHDKFRPPSPRPPPAPPPWPPCMTAVSPRPQ
mmetsp:Transcript_175956/g.564202  ORF Transcript_175956/g.564202 Transcript_175956/m.564202 type:complete len:244 (-) Transcript_175956:37-768(-)